MVGLRQIRMSLFRPNLRRQLFYDCKADWKSRGESELHGLKKKNMLSSQCVLNIKHQHTIGRTAE